MGTGGKAIAIAFVLSALGAGEPLDPRSPEAHSSPFAADLEEAAPPVPAEEASPEASSAPVPGEEAIPTSPPAPTEAFEGSEDIIARTNAALDAAAGAKAPQAASASPARPGFARQVLNALWALLVVLALIVVAYILVRRTNRGTRLLGGPPLGHVIGRMNLDPRTTLHFLAVADKVLVVGVTQGHIELLGTFDAAAFGTAALPETKQAPESPADFLAHLRVQTEALKLSPSSPAVDDDAEIASLRSDIERLQQYMKEGPRAPDV